MWNSKNSYNKFKSSYVKDVLDISGVLILRKNTDILFEGGNSYTLSGLILQNNNFIASFQSYTSLYNSYASNLLTLSSSINAYVNTLTINNEIKSAIYNAIYDIAVVSTPISTPRYSFNPIYDASGNYSSLDTIVSGYNTSQQYSTISGKYFTTSGLLLGSAQLKNFQRQYTIANSNLIASKTTLDYYTNNMMTTSNTIFINRNNLITQSIPIYKSLLTTLNDYQNQLNTISSNIKNTLNGSDLITGGTIYAQNNFISNSNGGHYFLRTGTTLTSGNFVGRLWANVNNMSFDYYQSITFRSAFADGSITTANPTIIDNYGITSPSLNASDGYMSIQSDITGTTNLFMDGFTIEKNSTGNVNFSMPNDNTYNWYSNSYTTNLQLMTLNSGQLFVNVPINSGSKTLTCGNINLPLYPSLNSYLSTISSYIVSSNNQSNIISNNIININSTLSTISSYILSSNNALINSINFKIGVGNTHLYDSIPNGKISNVSSINNLIYFLPNYALPTSQNYPVKTSSNANIATIVFPANTYINFGINPTVQYTPFSSYVNPAFGTVNNSPGSVLNTVVYSIYKNGTLLNTATLNYNLASPTTIFNQVYDPFGIQLAFLQIDNSFISTTTTYTVNAVFSYTNNTPYNTTYNNSYWQMNTDRIAGTSITNNSVSTNDQSYNNSVVINGGLSTTGAISCGNITSTGLTTNLIQSITGTTNGPLVIDPNFTTNNYVLIYDKLVVSGNIDCGGNTMTCNNCYASSWLGCTALQMNGGNINSCGSILYSSDDRLKNNESFITNALPLILQIRPEIYDKYTNFDLSGDFTRESGIIAQELYNINELRHLIHIPDDASGNLTTIQSINPNDDANYQNWGTTPASVNYIGLIPYLIKGIQEQNILIESLNDKINVLENKYLTQQNKINQLLTYLNLY